jgi:hypothetical protein
MTAVLARLLAYELSHAGWALRCEDEEYDGGARLRVRRRRAWRVAPCH